MLLVLSGKWPVSSKELSEDIKPYFNRKNELAIEQGMLLWGHRLVIPLKFREELLPELHSTHFGMVKMKSVAIYHSLSNEEKSNHASTNVLTTPNNTQCI